MLRAGRRRAARDDAAPPAAAPHGRLAPGADRADCGCSKPASGLAPFRSGRAARSPGLFALLVVAALTGSVFVALVPGGRGRALPAGYFGRRRRLRMREVQPAWPDGLRDLVASIAAGRSLTQAVTTLSRRPVRSRCASRSRGFPQLARVLGTGPALELVKEDLADPTSDRVLEVLLLAHERGGAIVRNILEDLVDATTRDLKLLDELETEGLEMRINARAVVVLPWFVLVALTARPGAFRDFYRSGGGVVTLVVAGVPHRDRRRRARPARPRDRRRAHLRGRRRRA